MRPADIQAELKKRGIRQQDLAEELEVSQFHIFRLIRKLDGAVSDRCFRHIAAKIDRLPEDVFPEHYFNNKKRNEAKPKKKTARILRFINKLY